jgi:hypothetical protein
MLPRTPFRIAAMLAVGIVTLGGVAMSQPTQVPRARATSTSEGNVYLYGR